MAVRSINRTGTTKGKAELLSSVWSDRELRKFMDICESLNISNPVRDIPRGSEDEVKFIQAFHPEFNPSQNIALIQEETDRSNGFPCFLIEVWKPVD